MKRITQLFTFVLIYCLIFFPVASDVQAADVNDLTVTVTDLGDRIMYTVTLIHTGGAEDNVHSQAIKMYGLTPVGGSIFCTGNPRS